MCKPQRSHVSIGAFHNIEVYLGNKNNVVIINAFRLRVIVLILIHDHMHVHKTMYKIMCQYIYIY